VLMCDKNTTYTHPL